jgi:uncharacterized membrane protein HdeD (DUF308 family)
MLEVLTRNWWTLVVRGLVAILFGIIVLIAPGITLKNMLFFFGAFALVDGIVGVIALLFHIGKYQNWWAMFFNAVLSIAAGLIALLWPGITALSLLWVIAAWAIVAGLFQLVAAVQLRTEIEGEWLLGLSGLVSIVFGVWLFLRPGAGILSLVWLLGIYALFFGALLMGLGFRVRHEHKIIKKPVQG